MEQTRVNEQQYKKALMIATVPSMIGQFNMANIQILLNLGYEVHVACNFDDRSVWTEKRVDEFKKQLDDLEVRYYQIDFPRSPKHIGMVNKSYKEIRELLFREKYALVHVHTPVAAAEVRLAAKDYNDAIDRRFKEGKNVPERLKVIYTAHGFHFYDGAPLKNWILFYPVEKELSRITDVLITINKEDYNRAKDHFYAKKVVKIPGVGVDTAKYETSKVDRRAKRQELGIPKDAFVIMSTGELNDNKNHAVIIKAIAKVNDRGIHYIIAGQGTNKERLKQLAVSLGIEDRVHVLGFRSDIVELLKSADCFAFPSKREGLGLAAIEAMASGLPLLTSDAGGINDYSVNGVTGFKYNADDVDGFASGIEKLMSSPEQRYKMSKNNVIFARKYDQSKTNLIMKEEYMDILQDLSGR